ncbi:MULTISPECIES: peptidylprolyl isomerase [Pacificimonas]|nr:MULTISPECIES: peptidylprolyl isomerase [Pacificimonas]MBZ6378615.1 SurA N-terminal domain-containing protein [Pacificimonas aurantium]
MLSLLRRVPSWVLGLVFVLIAVAFIITGTGIGNPLGGGGQGAPVAKVGDRTITSGFLAQNFERQLQQVRQQTPDLSTEEAVQSGALRAVLDRLIFAAGLQEFAREIGLSPSKRLVDADIANMEAFRGPTGQFSEETYRQVLARQNIDERVLRGELEGDVLRRHLMSVVLEGMPVPDGVVEPFALRQLERRTLRVGALPYSAFEVEDPTDEELAEFYEANIARFTIPERRRFRYAVFDRSSIASGITVTDEEIADFYERSDDLYGRAETRELRQIVTQDQEVAATAADRIRAGETMEAVAADLLGYSAEDVELGSVDEDQLSGTVGPDVAERVFAAERGDVVGPVESSFGYHVVAIDEVNSTAAQPLEDVADDIRGRLTAEKAEARLSERITAIQDELDEGASLSEVAEAEQFELSTPPALTQDGRSPSNTDFVLPAADRQVLTAAFELREGDDPVVEELGEGRYGVIALEEVVPPAPEPLEEIEDQARRAYIARYQIQAAAERAGEIVEAVNDGADLADLLRAEDVPPPQELTARRIELAAQQGQVPAYVALGFVQDEGEAGTVPLPEQGLQVIVETTDIVEGQIQDEPQLVETIRSQLRSAQESELGLAFAAAARDTVGVERFPGNVASLEAQYRTPATDPSNQ